MKSNKYRLLLFVMLFALLGVAQIAFAQDATATPEVQTTFDIQPVLVDYLQNLPDGYYGVKPENALKAMSSDVKPFVIDVREEKEIADGGYIGSAVLIPLRTLTQNLDKLPAQDQLIYVYCGIGHRGAVAVEVLNMLGYTNVYSISGGFTGWKAAGLPVATGMPAEPVVSDVPAPEYDPAVFDVVDKFLTTMPDTFYAISPANALKALSTDPKAFLIDVRGAQELIDNGYIDSQVNIPLRTLLDNPDLLPVDKNQPIIVYCAVGHRGALAMTALELLGYTDVTSIGGGYNNWVKGGLPIVAPA
jgi:rhodanese-related sulfurtransferase